MTLVDLDHSRFRRVQREIFQCTVVAECMAHACHLQAPGREKLDACCQYGADIDLAERDAVLRHGDAIRALLESPARDQPWFTDDVQRDVDFPSGAHVRTRPYGEGCIFLAHDGRGCAIHRASIDGGWDFRGVKPHVCRLFPLTYDHESIVLSDDYVDYSCAYQTNEATVYQVARATVAEVFGADLVTALDRVEAEVLASLATPTEIRTTVPGSL